MRTKKPLLSTPEDTFSTALSLWERYELGWLTLQHLPTQPPSATDCQTSCGQIPGDGQGIDGYRKKKSRKGCF